MNFSIANIQEITSRKWDSFVYENSSSFLWHTYDFIMAKNTWPNHSNESFAILDSNSEILGLFPLHRIRFKKYRFFERAQLDNIGGWLYASGNPRYEKILIQEYIKKNNEKIFMNSSINFATASLFHQEDPFFLQGIESHTARISVIDLSLSENSLWSNITKGHKADIKKAARQGVTFKKAVPDDLDIYYKMHEHVCRKSSLKPHNKKYFEFIFNIAIPRNHAFIGIAYYEGHPIAAANYAIYKDKAVYWTGASFEEAYKIGANHFLHWNMIQELQCGGILTLDMGEVFFKHPSPKIQGIVKFKRGFGGELRACFKSMTEKRFKI